MNRLSAAALIALLAAGTCAAQDDVDSFKSLAKQAHVDPSVLTQKVKTCRRAAAEAAAPLFLFLDTDTPHALLVLRQDQLEQPYLLSATLAQGTGERGTLPAEDLASFLFYFHMAGDKLQVMRRNTGFRAQPGTPESRAVANGYPDSVIATIAISSTSDEEHLIAVPAAALFMQDLSNLGQRLAAAYPGAGGGPDLALDESRIESLAAFPRNAEASVQLLYNQSSASPSNVLDDSRKLTLRVHYSINALPDSPDFQPRKADPRVGYFTTDYQDFSSEELKDDPSPDVHVIDHWNLQKQDPSLPVSEVKKPITYWLDDSIPEPYRPAVKEGILSWNAAFEAIGFKNAVVVKEVDKDMTPKERAEYDPSSASYNVVRWFMGEGDGFAEAPSRVNPLTGEIFNANIRIGDMMSRASKADVEFANVSKTVKGRMTEGDYIKAAALQAAADRGLLRANQPLTAEQQKALVNQFLTEIAAHESGHTLGLRHNFAGSEMLPYSQLGKDGLLTSSVMDYLPMNIPTDKKPGPYYQTKPGPYDVWAIEYGYKPVDGGAQEQSAALKSIADRSAKDGRLAYATDEDADASDPDVRRFDLGRGPIPFAQDRMRLARKLWSQLEKKAPADVKSSADLRREFSYGVNEYFGAAEAVVPLVGGVRAHRDAPAADGVIGRPAFEPVNVAEQREALRFLAQNVFADKPLQVSPALLRRMGTDRLDGESTAPYAMDTVVNRIQGRILGSLYSPETLKNLTQGRLLADDPKQALSVAEEMSSVRKAIWTELDGEQLPTLPLYRRNLQQTHIETLIATMNNEEVPGEARSLAQHELVTLSGQIQRSLGRRGADETSRAHLEAAHRRIQDALKKD